MPLSGGAADKFGNRYEGRWTVYSMLQVLCEEAATISLELVGPLGEGVEFALALPDGTTEFHQVKRQNGGQGPWSLRNLAAAGVLAAFKNKLNNSHNRCVFISTSSADTLQELVERAQSAQDASQFRQEFLKSQALAASFDLLRQIWDPCSEEEGYRLLRQIRVETIAEATLVRETGFRLETLVDGNPDTAADVLAQFALDAIHQTLYAQDLWRRLRDHTIHRRVWNNDPHVLAAVEAANARYLQPIRCRDIHGQAISREESRTVLSKLQAAAGKRSVLISGNAGTGKTGVGAEVVERVLALGWPTLALRLDRLEPAATPRQLGVQMDLPGSPATVLANIAHGRDCLLFIDQLDAVSTTSGRNPQFFDCVAEIINECAIHPHLHLMLSCRHFDLANDERLRRLVGAFGIADEVQVQALSENQVRQVIDTCGFSSQRLTPKQIALLAIPLHLKIFTEIISTQDSTTEEVIRFETLKDLYDQYWEDKHHVLRQRLGREAHWGRLCDLFFQRTLRDQSLSVPAAVLDEFASDRAALISEGVLVQEGRQVSFFHETFFDYAYARRFIASGQHLLELLQSGEQHLFLRATVRQILTHERDEDFETYISDLQEVLTAPDVRFHLKKLVFQWLRTHSAPTRAEWDIVRSLIAPLPAHDIDHAWSVAFTGSWFTTLDSTGFIEMELDSGDEQRINRIVHYLASVANEVPERVAEIVQGFVERPAPWPSHAQAILMRADGDKSRHFIDLYLQLVEKDVLQDSDSPVSSSGHTPLLYDLPEKQPLWGLDVLEAWVLQRIRLHELTGDKNPFERDRYGDAGLNLQKLVQAVPAAFAQRMLPITLELIRKSAHQEGPVPRYDRNWSFRSYGPHYAFQEQFFDAVIEALRWVAVHDPESLQPQVERIQQYLDCQSAGCILARVYTANGERFAEAAAVFLLSSPAWLDLGWSDSSHWISRQVLEAITPYCSPETLFELEQQILSYYSRWERENPRWLGLAQRTLLNGIELTRRSRAVRRRLGELQRKFGADDGEPPQGVRGGAVGPPFNARWERLRDRDWLRAIAHYPNEHRRDTSFRDFLKGGANQLAGVLKEQAKHEPARFARLLLRFPRETNPTYFTHVLWGISEGAKADFELVWSALRHCHALPDRPCGDFISNVVRAYGDEEMPLDILELVAWYAVQAPDPTRRVLLQPETGRENTTAQNVASDEEDSKELEHRGLNSVRGGMARAIADLLFDRPERLEFFRQFLQRMVLDRKSSVRTQIAYTLLPVLNTDRSFAVALFLQLCAGPSDALLGTDPIFEFLRYACQTHRDDLTPLMERMLRSANEKTVQMGARFACFAGLNDFTVLPFADRCIEGSEPMRHGAAEVAAANLRRAANRSWCIKVLSRLFNDDAAEVRKAAAYCFQALEKDELGEFSDLVPAFIESRAFEDQAFWLFHALENTTAILPDVVCTACERTVQLLKSALLEERQNSNRHVTRNTSVVLRLYERTKSADVKRRSLDIIDLILQNDVYGMDHSLSNRED